MVGNRAKVEASIVNAYIQLETSYLREDYFGPETKTNVRRLKRNEVSSTIEHEVQVSVFNYPGRRGCISSRRRLEDDEFRKAVHFILSNIPEFREYLELFESQAREQHPHFDEAEIYELTLLEFPRWLREHIWGIGSTTAIYEWIHNVAQGFDWHVTCCTTYKVNNYKFHTERHSEDRPTVNCSVYVQGIDGNDYYGVIEDIIQMRCKFNHRLQVVLFKCRWFDPNHVKVFPSMGVVQVNTNKLHVQYDPFILAQQAVQVYFTDFPGRLDLTAEGWVAVIRVKPTNAIDMTQSDVAFQDSGGQPAQIVTPYDIEDVTDLASEELYEYTEGDPLPTTESEQSSPNEISD